MSILVEKFNITHLPTVHLEDGRRQTVTSGFKPIRFSRGGAGGGKSNRENNAAFEPGEGCFSPDTCSFLGSCQEEHYIGIEIGYLQQGMAEDPETLRYQVEKSHCSLAASARRAAQKYLSPTNSRG